MAKANRFKQNDNKNAICYYRYSDKVQRDVSIEQQQEAARKFASEKGLHIIKEYADRAISGTRKDRPAFQRMLLEAEKLRPAYLIVWKTDRFSRDRFDAVRAKGHLRECGVRIEYIAEPMPEDEGARIILESIEEAIAEQFIINHSQNVVRGLKYNAENALYNGRVRLGYKGERNKRYEVDPATAPVVKKIYREYADGVPMQKIADELNKDFRSIPCGGFCRTKHTWEYINGATLLLRMVCPRLSTGHCLTMFRSGWQKTGAAGDLRRSPRQKTIKTSTIGSQDISTAGNAAAR